VTYVDTSVALAYLLVEERRPAIAFWQTALIASRLLEYEVWCRLHGLGLSGARGDIARELLARIAMIELSPLVLARALEPFPHPLRTLDALHLATLDFLRQRRLEPALASYDQRMVATARSMGIAITAMD
jgi:predicted nucleic acid-binding protein